MFLSYKIINAKSLWIYLTYKIMTTENACATIRFKCKI